MILNGHAEPLPQRVKNVDVENKENKNVELFNIDKTETNKTAPAVVASKEVKESETTTNNNNNVKESQQQPDKSSWAKIIGTRGTDSSATSSQTPSSISFQNHSTQSQTNSTTSIKVGGNANIKEKSAKPTLSSTSTSNATTAAQNGPSSGSKKPSTTSKTSQSSSTGQSQQTGQRNSNNHHHTNNNNNNSNANNNNSNANNHVNNTNNNANTNVNNGNGNTNNSGTLDLSGNLDDDKRFGRYPDNQQVFVGNLNQDLTEVELKKIFSDYGKVVEVRINTNSKQQSGRRLPNYGFVVFDDKVTVDNLLGSAKSHNIAYTNDKGVEFRLNVEEKRARQGRQ